MIDDWRDLLPHYCPSCGHAIGWESYDGFITGPGQNYVIVVCVDCAWTGDIGADGLKIDDTEFAAVSAAQELWARADES